jgi:hypothetical protein
MDAFPGGLTAQLKGENLMAVPSTADGLKAVVRALRSLDARHGESFDTFTQKKDLCVRLLAKNLGRCVPESVVREELESLNIRVQGVPHLQSGRRDQDTSKPKLHYIGVARASGIVSAITHRTLRLESVGGVIFGSKRPLQCKRYQGFGYT